MADVKHIAPLHGGTISRTRKGAGGNWLFFTGHMATTSKRPRRFPSSESPVCRLPHRAIARGDYIIPVLPS